MIALINGEIDKRKAGLRSGILMKMNSLTDKDIIDKLIEAFQAGVTIKLIIRGICCIVPGISGITENISVISIIGRFLEHSRIYCFGDGDEIQIYISSADMMTRNTERRVEIACPILDKDLKLRIWDILKMQLSDNVKASKLYPDGSYYKNTADAPPHINCQNSFIEDAITAGNTKPPSKGFFSKTISFIQKYIPENEEVKN